MLINEVVSVVGLSRKSIRYYEEQGLLSPKRNVENDYRIYSEEDIRTLKILKFLRELDVPINDLKSLKENKLTLAECMQDRIKKINYYEENYQKIKNLCQEIYQNKDEYHTINITKYEKEIHILNKEGFTMRNTKTDNSKKIRGAIISSTIFSLFYLFIGLIITYFQFTESEKMPWILYIFIMLIFILPIIGIATNLVARIKEIKGGEEDEASKY